MKFTKEVKAESEFNAQLTIKTYPLYEKKLKKKLFKEKLFTTKSYLCLFSVYSDQNKLYIYNPNVKNINP